DSASDAPGTGGDSATTDSGQDSGGSSDSGNDASSLGEPATPATPPSDLPSATPASDLSSATPTMPALHTDGSEDSANDNTGSSGGRELLDITNDIPGRGEEGPGTAGSEAAKAPGQPDDGLVSGVTVPNPHLLG